MTIRALVIRALGLEDDKDWQSILGEKLDMHNLHHEIHTAQNEFKEAFARIKPHIVFIDWLTPGATQTGNQLAETLLKINPSCLVFMVTGWDVFRDLHYFVYKVGGFAWVLKDENFDNEFSTHLERAIAHFEKLILIDEGFKHIEMEMEQRDLKKAKKAVRENNNL